MIDTIQHGKYNSQSAHLRLAACSFFCRLLLRPFRIKSGKTSKHVFPSLIRQMLLYKEKLFSTANTIRNPLTCSSLLAHFFAVCSSDPSGLNSEKHASMFFLLQSVRCCSIKRNYSARQIQFAIRSPAVRCLLIFLPSAPQTLPD